LSSELVQAVIGSVPHADGNFDRNNNFSTVITDGKVSIPIDTINSFAGSVAYVIPASKSEHFSTIAYPYSGRSNGIYN